MDLPKRALIIGMCVLGLTMGIGGPAFGITLYFSSTEGASLSFTRGIASPSFEFNNNPSGNSFHITAVQGGAGGETVGLLGSITGTFAIGSVSDNSATVSNSGTLTITDKDNNPFTAQVVWYTIFSKGALGGINEYLEVNLSDIHYSGANPDLQGWGADQTAVVVFSGEDLSVLITEENYVTAFSGNLSAVPAPAVVLLLGTGLAGLAGLRYRGRRKG